jgi:hypothetical protein
MSSAQVQVLRQLGGNWLECQDAQGIFYFNQATKQQCDYPPPELAASMPKAAAASYQPAYAPQAAAVPYQPAYAPQAAMAPSYAQQGAVPQQPAASQAVVKFEIGIWKICEDAQGKFYFNTQTQQSYDQPPAELVQLVQQQQRQEQQQQQQQQQQREALAYQQKQAMMTQQKKIVPKPAAPLPAASTPQVTVKATIGIWKICQDAQGEFYVNAQTQQSFDEPPPELLQLLQAQEKAAGKAQVPQAPPAAPAQDPPAGQATVKTQIGVWAICEDAQGEFYVNTQTQQSFDQPPPELEQMFNQLAMAQQGQKQQQTGGPGGYAYSGYADQQQQAYGQQMYQGYK